MSCSKLFTTSDIWIASALIYLYGTDTLQTIEFNGDETAVVRYGEAQRKKRGQERLAQIEADRKAADLLAKAVKDDIFDTLASCSDDEEIAIVRAVKDQGFTPGTSMFASALKAELQNVRRRD